MLNLEPFSLLFSCSPNMSERNGASMVSEINENTADKRFRIK
jgi:hypothetical protein